MDIRHKQDEPVRAYLLGMLDNWHAVALEQRYFVDRDFFDRVRDAETTLIEDFIEHRLSAAEKLHFEKRYLEVPDLARRVEEVRKAFAITQPAAGRARAWQLSLAVSMLILLLAGGVVYRRARQRSVESGSGLPQVAVNISVVNVWLTPGVTKSATAHSVVIAPPPRGTVVKLSLELPGRHSTEGYQALVALIGDDGRRSRIWTSGIIRPVAAPSGSVLTVDLAPNLLRSGDYMVEVGLPERDTLETYLFRVSPVP
jgi:hypothetical protein